MDRSPKVFGYGATFVGALLEVIVSKIQIYECPWVCLTDMIAFNKLLVINGFFFVLLILK